MSMMTCAENGTVRDCRKTVGEGRSVLDLMFIKRKWDTLPLISIYVPLAGQFCSANTVCIYFISAKVGFSWWNLLAAMPFSMKRKHSSICTF